MNRFLCTDCGERAVTQRVEPVYHADLYHLGQTYRLPIKIFEVWRCELCGGESFGEKSLAAMDDALDQYLKDGNFEPNL